VGLLCPPPRQFLLQARYYFATVTCSGVVYRVILGLLTSQTFCRRRGYAKLQGNLGKGGRAAPRSLLRSTRYPSCSRFAAAARILAKRRAFSHPTLPWQLAARQKCIISRQILLCGFWQLLWEHAGGRGGGSRWCAGAWRAGAQFFFFFFGGPCRGLLRGHAGRDSAGARQDPSRPLRRQGGGRRRCVPAHA
jgi:hypothetical protein